MHRLLLALPVLLVIVGAPADAARHKKMKAGPARHAPAYLQPANRPPWAAPQQCYTNDGNGRFLPCDLGDGR